MAELTDMDGVAGGRASNLKEAGFESIEDIATAEQEALAEVNYLPEDTALELIVQAQNMVEDSEADESDEPEQSIAEEIGDAVEEVEDEIEEGADDIIDEAEETVEDVAETVEETAEDIVEGDTDSDEDDGPNVVEFSLTFDEGLEYDTFFDAVMGQRSNMLQTNRDGVEQFDHALDQMRESTGTGTTIELSMEEGQLNDLHNCVRQTMIAYKGDNLIDHMEALQSVLNDINDVRDEHLF